MRPVVDAGLRRDPVLPATPRSLLEARDFTQLPMLAGLVRDEALQTVLCECEYGSTPVTVICILWTELSAGSGSMGHECGVIS